MSTQLAEFRTTVDRLGDEFCKALPEHIKVEKFQRIVVSAVASNNELLAADRTSLLSSCMKAAADGLLLDGREAALVTFRTKQQDGSWLKMVQYMPMIGGILKKIRNSKELESIMSEVVCERDEFDRWIDEDGEHFKHRPAYGEDRGPSRLVYAFARTKDGGKYLEVMDHAAVERVRAVSRAKDSGPWVSWWDEMARKTVTRRLAKRLPMSTDVAELFERDDENTDFSQTVVTQQGSRPERPTRLQAIVGAQEAAPVEDAPAEVGETRETIDGEVF